MELVFPIKIDDLSDRGWTYSFSEPQLWDWLDRAYALNGITLGNVDNTAAIIPVCTALSRLGLLEPDAPWAIPEKQGPWRITDSGRSWLTTYIMLNGSPK